MQLAWCAKHAVCQDRRVPTTPLPMTPWAWTRTRTLHWLPRCKSRNTPWVAVAARLHKVLVPHQRSARLLQRLLLRLVSCLRLGLARLLLVQALHPRSARLLLRLVSRLRLGLARLLLVQVLLLLSVRLLRLASHQRQVLVPHPRLARLPLPLVSRRHQVVE